MSYDFFPGLINEPETAQYNLFDSVNFSKLFFLYPKSLFDSK